MSTVKGSEFRDKIILFEKGTVRLTIEVFKDQMWLKYWEEDTDSKSNTYGWYWSKGDIPMKKEELDNMIHKLTLVQSIIVRAKK